MSSWPQYSQKPCNRKCIKGYRKSCVWEIMTLSLIIHSLSIINKKWGFLRHSYKGTFHQIQVSILLAWPESGWWDSECTACLSNTVSDTLVLKNTPCTADSRNTGTDRLSALCLFFSTEEITTITRTSIKLSIKKKKKWGRLAVSITTNCKYPQAKSCLSCWALKLQTDVGLYSTP